MVQRSIDNFLWCRPLEVEMSAHITLSAVRGNLEYDVYVFDEPACCIVGRGHDCDIRVDSDSASATVSRHHCVIEINPPYIQVRDLGSRFGTFVNGKCIGQRSQGEGSDKVKVGSSLPCDLQDGDEIHLGYVVLRVSVGDEVEVPEEVALFPLFF
jgi:pSer/pThr/pTyr-binding forkhead associated (FHA) protein